MYFPFQFPLPKNEYQILHPNNLPEFLHGRFDLHSFSPQITIKNSINVMFFASSNVYLHLDNFDPGMDLKWIDHQLIDGQFASTGYPAIYQNCSVSL